MVYYDKREYKLVEFKKSDNKNKMYYAILENKTTHKRVKVHFGDSKMMNYQDLTGLNKYPHLIHGDRLRRERYRARHRVFLKEGYYSPSYFSWTVLW